MSHLTPTDTTTVWIVIPAFNEARVIQEVIHEVRSAGYTNIIVVDDCSHDDTFERVSQTGVVTLHHQLNRGKGAATKTGIEAAKKLNADIIITMDGDGQHDPQDIKSLIRPIRQQHCDVVLGSRLITIPKGMPSHKIIANKIGNFFTWWVYGLWVTDSQSGFRAYSRHAAEIINTKTDRYEYDSEVIREINLYKLTYTEVPIQVRYTAYSMSKPQKQNLINGIKTLYRIFWNLLH